MVELWPRLIDYSRKTQKIEMTSPLSYLMKAGMSERLRSWSQDPIRKCMGSNPIARSYFFFPVH